MSMSFVAGIDHSTRAVDVVLVDENGEQPPVWHHTPLKGHDAMERARHLRGRYLLYRHDWEDVIAVGIEEPRGHQTGPLFRMQGALLAQVPPHLLVQPWIPSQWRKAVGLPGNASKAAVRAWALDHDADLDWPQDACDALAIAHATLAALRREEA